MARTRGKASRDSSRLPVASPGSPASGSSPGKSSGQQRKTPSSFRHGQETRSQLYSCPQSPTKSSLQTNYSMNPTCPGVIRTSSAWTREIRLHPGPQPRVRGSAPDALSTGDIHHPGPGSIQRPRRYIPGAGTSSSFLSLRKSYAHFKKSYKVY